jgi:hypothetical protein
MRKPLDTKNFKIHRNTAKCNDNKKRGSTPSLHHYFSPSSLHKASSVDQSTNRTLNIYVPCPGLTREANPNVARYLCRTATAGGGAPSRIRIAQTIYGKALAVQRWSQLTAAQQHVVQKHEVALYKWRNLKNLGTVFSVECTLKVAVASLLDEPPPCLACDRLLSLHTFQVQIARPMPSEENMKFVPKVWRDEAMGGLYLKYHGLRVLLEEVIK